MKKLVIQKLTGSKENRKLFREFDERLAEYEKKLDKNLIPSKRIIYNQIPKVLKSPKCAVFIARYNKVPVGYIVAKVLKQYPWYGGGFYGYIECLFVDESLRGKGVASKLFLSAKQYFKKMKITKISLRVFSNNKSAIAFYRKLGFDTVVLEMKRNY